MMAIATPKPHIEFSAVDFRSDWEIPPGYPPGFYQKILASDLDEEKKRALFYEAAPFSKTRATQRDINELVADGFVPMRYRHIRG